MNITSFEGRYRFLSNFWPAPVIYEGRVYPTTEHAYQAAKFPAEKRRSFETGTAARAKRMGRRPGRRGDWDAVKLGIMETLVRQKFTEIADLRDRLMDTGTQQIEEGNTWGDVFWGKDLFTGTGENHLGKILMAVREELR